MPDPRLVEIRGIEERAFNAWPALETRVFAGWLLRFSGGYTKRANSINAWAPTEPLEAIIEAAEKLYRERQSTPIVRLTPLAGPGDDALLANRGYAKADETLVMSAPIAPRQLAPREDLSIEIRAAPEPGWLDGFARANAVPPERRALHDSMVSHIAQPAAFATASRNGQPIAWGIAAAERGMVGLFDIVTSPDARRSGAGRHLVSVLLAWGEAHGAAASYLQVVGTNAPAIALYRSLGFHNHYTYHYRIAAL